jgi:hypothetical protein
LIRVDGWLARSGIRRPELGKLRALSQAWDQLGPCIHEASVTRIFAIIAGFALLACRDSSIEPDMHDSTDSTDSTWEPDNTASSGDENQPDIVCKPGEVRCGDDASIIETAHPRV